MTSADFPFAPKRFPFFYGWMIVVASTAGTILSIPGQTMGVSVFTDPLIRDLGLSRNALSSAYMGGTITSACLLPYAGHLFDRVGARLMIVVSSLALGGTLVFLGSCDSIAAFVLRASRGALAPATATFAVLAVGFFSVRFWGQGVLTMVSRAMLGKWFDRRRGFASALSGVFVSAGFAVAPVFLLARIRALGWRGAWLELAVVCTAWTIVGWLLYRDNPEECGLEMDGSPARAVSASSATAVVREFSLGDALRTYAFWTASLGLSLFGLLATAVTFHITSIGDKAGLDEDAAVAIFVPMAAVSIAVNLVGGWLADRVRIRNLFCVLLGAQALGSVALFVFETWWGRGLVAVGFGAAGGLFALLMTVVWPRFFGRIHLGSISGLCMAMTVFGSALGPKLFAMVEARAGGYESAYAVGAVAALAIGVASLWLENPQRRLRPPS